MLVCGHDREPFGAPICMHLRVCREPWLGYVRWYTGSGLDAEFLCHSCADERQNGRPITTAVVCQECFDYATTEIGDPQGVRGKPEIRIRSEPFDLRLQSTGFPQEAGKIAD